jgi:hypothetical protein
MCLTGHCTVPSLLFVLLLLLFVLLLQPIYLIGKNAGINHWAKRLMPGALWSSMMQNSLANKL